MVEELIIGLVAIQATVKTLAVEAHADLAMLAFPCAIVLVEVIISVTLFTFVQTQAFQTILHTELADP